MLYHNIINDSHENRDHFIIILNESLKRHWLAHPYLLPIICNNLLLSMHHKTRLYTTITLTYSKEYLLKISYKRMAWFLPKGVLVFFFRLVWRTIFQLCSSIGLITTILTVIIFDHIPPMSFQFLLLSDTLIFQLCSTNSQKVCACVIMAVGTQSSNYLVIWDWVCTVHWPSISSNRMPRIREPVSVLLMMKQKHK